jgi:hypothetical protein
MARDRDDRDDRDDDRDRRDDRDDDRERGRRRDRDDRDDDRDDDYDPRPRRDGEAVPGGTAGFTISIIALVLGTCALLFAFIPCLGIYAMYPGGFAVLLSILGIVLSKGSKVLGIIAVAVSLAGTGVAYWQYTALKKAAQDVQKDLDKFQKDWQKELDRNKNK